LPKNKGKNTDDSITDANYLWISLIATSLNENGRAGFVMANSASDAGNSEYQIRKKIVDSGMVDCMVSMPSNMFFTVTLPATLWFFDKQKMNSSRSDKILFIDARNTYHQINRAQREWTEEHIQNLTAIVRLYRGETNRYLELVTHYDQQAVQCIQQLPVCFDDFHRKLSNGLVVLKQYAAESKSKCKAEEQRKLAESGLMHKLEEFALPEVALPSFGWQLDLPYDNTGQLEFTEILAAYSNALKEVDANLKTQKDRFAEIWTEADKLLKVKSDKSWAELGLNNLVKALDELQQTWKNAIDQVDYWYTNIHWLQSRFPKAIYTNVVGLCKLADKNEYAEEQDYSLNAGRYVGVEIMGDDLSKDEFKESLTTKRNLLFELNSKDLYLAKEIENQLTEIINDLE
jgi:type I restriction enzyme M protein